MNVALLSNSLINRTLAFQTSYVFGEEIENIFLPSENHSREEMFFSGQGHVYVCDNIDNIISKSDIIVATNMNSIHRFPKSKKIVYVNNPWANENDKAKKIDGSFHTDGKPVIVILSLGVFTDLYYTEMSVNKILSESGAKVYQIYSEQTMSLLSDLLNHDLLNRNLLDIKKEEADVIVVSVDGTKYRNDAEFVCELSRLSPNMLFVCIDRTVTDVSEIGRIAEIVCNVSLTIRSPYIPYDVGTGVKYPVYCGLCKEDLCVNSVDRELGTYLKDHIMKKLYFPSKTILL